MRRLLGSPSLETMQAPGPSPKRMAVSGSESAMRRDMISEATTRMLPYRDARSAAKAMAIRDPALATGMSMAGVVVRPSFWARTEAGPGNARSGEPEEKRMRPMSLGARPALARQAFAAV